MLLKACEQFLDSTTGEQGLSDGLGLTPCLAKLKEIGFLIVYLSQSFIESTRVFERRSLSEGLAQNRSACFQ